MEKITHYDVLGVSNDATQEEIKKAYQRQARHSHPDTGNPNSAHLFTLVTDAYNALKTPEARAVYDASLREPAPSYASYSTPSYTPPTYPYPTSNASTSAPEFSEPVVTPEPVVLDMSFKGRVKRLVRFFFGSFNRVLFTYAGLYVVIITITSIILNGGFSWAGNLLFFALVAGVLAAYTFGSGIFTRLLFYGSVAIVLYSVLPLLWSRGAQGGIMDNLGLVWMGTTYLAAALACFRVRRAV